MDQAKTGSVRAQGSRGHRIGADGVAGGDRRQARALPGHGGRTSRHLGRAGEADRTRTSAASASGSRRRQPRATSTYDRGHRPLHAAGGARGRADATRSSPACVLGGFQGDDGGDAGRAQGDRGLPHRQGRRLARARSRAVRRHRALLPARVQRQPGRRVDPGARRRQGQARAGARASPTSAAATAPRRSSWRKAFPRSTLRRLRLPPPVDRAGTRARRARRAGRSGVVRGGHRQGLSRARYDLVALLRLPARHGRSGRRRGARAPVAGAGRHLAAGRAVRRRPRRGQPQPGRPRLLLGLDAGLHPGLARAGGRHGARRPGRRGAAAAR